MAKKQQPKNADKQPEPRIEYMALREIQQWPHNPKTHDVPQIVASLKRHGFILPMVKDEATGRLVAGHGRLAALTAMRDAHESAPKYVHVLKNGDWAVGVLHGVAFTDEREAEAYLLADNRLVEIGGWDEEALNEMLARVKTGPLDGLGWSTEEIDALTQAVNENVTLPEMPSAKPVDEKMEGYQNSAIRQVVLHFPRAEYEEFVTLCDQQRELHKAETNAALVLKLLREDAAR